jgi:hypothetical protein
MLREMTRSEVDNLELPFLDYLDPGVFYLVSPSHVEEHGGERLD